MTHHSQAFAALDSIDWASLEHAYGAADDTPARLRALVGDDDAKRADARYWLSASIHHQGSLYSASAPAVPFLVAAACDPEVKERAWIVRFLADLAVGRPDRFLFAGFDLEAPGMGQWFQGEEAEPARLAFEAVERSLADLLALFDDADPSVRAAAAFTASFFARHAERVRSRARARIEREEDDLAATSLLFCVALQDNYTKTITVQDLAAARFGGEGGVALAAAVIASYGRAPFDGADGEALGTYRRLLGGDVAPPTWPELPWARGDLGQLALEHLIKLVPRSEGDTPGPRTEAVAAILFGVLERTPLERASDREVALAGAAMRPLFRIATPEPPPAEGWTLETLRPSLRRFAEAVARRPFLGSEGLYAAFEENALPGDPDALRAFLGIHLPGPLDETVTVDGTERTARECLADGDFAAIARSPRAVAIAVEVLERGGEGARTGKIDGMSFQLVSGEPPSRSDAAEQVLSAAIAENASAALSSIEELAEGIATQGPPKTHGRSSTQIHESALTLLANGAARASAEAGRAPAEVCDVLVEGELVRPHAWAAIERYFRAIGETRTERLLLGLAERGWKRTWPDAFTLSVDAAFVARASTVLAPDARDRFTIAIAERGDTSALFEVLANDPRPALVAAVVKREASALESMESWARDDIADQRARVAARFGKLGLAVYGPVAALVAYPASSNALRTLGKAILDAVDSASPVGTAMRDARLAVRDERGLMPLARARDIVASTSAFRKGGGEMKDGTFVLESDLVWAALLSLEDDTEFVTHAKRIAWEFHVRGRDNTGPFARYGAGILPWLAHHIDEQGILRNVPWCIVPCLLAIDTRDALEVALRVNDVHELLPGQAPLGGGPGVFAAGAGTEAVAHEGHAFLTPTVGLDLARRWIARHGHGYAALAELAGAENARATELLRDRARALGSVVVEAIEAGLGRERTSAILSQLGVEVAPLDPSIEAALAEAPTIDVPRGPLWTVAELDDDAREYSLPLWDNAAYTTGAMRVTGFASKEGDVLVVETLSARPNPLAIVEWWARAYGPGAKTRSAAEELVDPVKDELEPIFLDETSYVCGISNEAHLWDGEAWHHVPLPFPHGEALLTVSRAALGLRGEPQKASHKLPRTFASVPQELAPSLRRISPLEGLLFQLCARAKDDMFAFDTGLREKLGLPEDAVELFVFDDVEWVSAGHPASSSKDVVLLCEALRRRKKISRLVGAGNARPEHWAPLVADIRAYDGNDAWCEGESPLEPELPEHGIGASPYLSWLVSERGYPHGASLLHASAWNQPGQAEQTVPYLLGCTDFVMQTSWPRRTACIWARVIGGAQRAWNAKDPGVAEALTKDTMLLVDEARALAGAFVARTWSPPSYVGAELVWLLEALVGPQATLAMFLDAMEKEGDALAHEDRPALAAAAFELGFVLRRTMVGADALRERLRAVLVRLEASSPDKDVVRALGLVLNGRAAAERHAREERDYAFVSDDVAWARARILDPGTKPSRPDLFLASIAGPELFDKWAARFDTIADLGWLAVQAGKGAGPSALALALRVHTTRPELQAAVATVVLERPQAKEELVAALRGAFPEAARALLEELERREEAAFDARYGGDDEDDDDGDEDDEDDDEE